MSLESGNLYLQYNNTKQNKKQNNVDQQQKCDIPIV